jgi:hypothetical protein
VTEPYSTFETQACRRCGARLLVGRSDGLGWRMDATPVTADDAAVLLRYGVTPLALDARVCGLVPRMWHPSDHRRPGRFLVAPHVCGSAHSQRSMKEK